MKQKITLVGLMLLIAVLTFGQIAPEKKHPRFKESNFERHANASVSNDRNQKPERTIHNNWHHSQRNLHLNEQAIKHRLDSLIYHEWNEEVSQWVADSKDEYTYDVSGKITQRLLYFDPDQNTNEWGVADYKDTYTFDGTGKPTQTLLFEWDESTNQWLIYSKEEYTYDFTGKKTHLHIYDRDESTSQWIPDFKEEYTYDANGILTQSFGYYWNQNTSQWDIYYKDEYTYDGNGNNTQNIKYNWNQSNSQWYFSYKSEYTYDANGNKTQLLGTYWLNNQWLIEGKEEYTYDLTISFSELIVPFFYNNEGYVNKLLEGFWYNWNETTNSWVVNDKYNWHYSQQNVTNVEIVKAETVSISPNPASEYLNISFMGNVNSATFELFDIQGRKVLSKAVVNHEQITLKELNNGMYIYNLYIEGKKQSGKLMKE